MFSNSCSKQYKAFVSVGKLKVGILVKISENNTFTVKISENVTFTVKISEIDIDVHLYE